MMNMKENDKAENLKEGPLDTPDEVKSDKESIYDKDPEMQTVDPIPMEELNQQVEDEKHNHHTKDTSSSEERYPG